MTESVATNQIKIEPSWKEHLLDQFQTDYMTSLRSFLVEEQKQHSIYPSNSDIFQAFELTPFNQVKVVILGQDPYHGPNQAHGLSFSVRPGTPPPPSLINIYKELVHDIGITPPTHGYLQEWALQGVLLLNAVLTVRKGQAGSHQGKGWEKFTDAVIKKINDGKEHVVFILWGNYAQKKGDAIDRTKHLVISSPHPSPLSAHRGFFGSAPFSQANTYLKKHGLEPISWGLSNTDSFRAIT